MFPTSIKALTGYGPGSGSGDRARSFGPATLQVITQLLDRHVIEAEEYLACQNILEGLGRRNRSVLEAACQQLVNRNGYATYSTIKRIMAAINSDQDTPGPVVLAAKALSRSKASALLASER